MTSLHLLTYHHYRDLIFPLIPQCCKLGKWANEQTLGPHNHR